MWDKESFLPSVSKTNIIDDLAFDVIDEEAPLTSTSVPVLASTQEEEFAAYMSGLSMNAQAMQLFYKKVPFLYDQYLPFLHFTALLMRNIAAEKKLFHNLAKITPL